MLNKNLRLEECLDILNEMCKSIVKLDYKEDELMHILVKKEEADNLKKLILNQEDLEKYLQEQKILLEEKACLDLMNIWGSVCSSFDLDIIFDTEQYKFYLPEAEQLIYYKRRENKELKDVIENVIDVMADYIKEIYDKERELEAAGISFSYLGYIGSGLEELLMDTIGIPEDTIDTLGVGHPNVFCRDMFINWIGDYLFGEISKQELITRLKNWSELS